jgi:vancomycin resistance protein YoaR
MRKKHILLILLSAAILFTAGFVYQNYRERQAEEQWKAHMADTVERSTFYEGTYLDGTALGGLTPQEAGEIFEKTAAEKLDKLKVELTYQDQTWSFGSEDIGASIDWEDKLNELYDLAREGSLEERYNQVEAIREKGEKLETSLTMDISQIRDDITAIAESLTVEPVDADIQFFPDKENKFSLTPEKKGQMVDAEALYQSAEQILNSGEPGTIAIEPVPTEPKMLMADLEKATKKIVSFSTDLLKSTENRAYNVELSLKKINGLRLNPGEIFSFNETVGPRTKSAGFRTAPVIMPDKSMKDDWGGGVCQASSTVFNSAALAGMEIVERYHHSFPVAYVPAGTDATVTYGGADFRFKNNKKTPIFFHTYRIGKLVYVDIYGEPIPDGGSYKLVTELTETIKAPEPQRILDTAGKYVTTAGGQKEHVKSRTGYKLNTYRVLYKNGKQLDSELLVKNFYRPIQGITYYREGTPQSSAAPTPTPAPENGGNNGDSATPNPGGDADNADSVDPNSGSGTGTEGNAGN